MVHRFRIAPPSDAHVLLRQRRAGGPSRPARAVLKHLAAGALLAGAAYALPELLGPGFLRDRLGDAMATAATAGAWVRTALVVAFESIPVR